MVEVLERPRPHPAKYTNTVTDAIASVVEDEIMRQRRPLRVWDPFGGTGRIHLLKSEKRLPVSTIAGELEPEWASVHSRTVVSDAVRVPLGDSSVDITATSPCYGNRMADTYDGRDGSRRMTYRIALGRELSNGSAAGMQWGPLYRDLHSRAILEMLRVTAPPSEDCEGGLILVNMSNHVRDGEEQLVVEWWVQELLRNGLALVKVDPVITPRARQGANHDARAEFEYLIVCRVVRPYAHSLF